jgi:hypothetical protein
MKVFYCADHDGHWPVGVASIVVAPSESIARLCLYEKLTELGIGGKKDFTLTELSTDKTQVLILRDGDY